MMKKIFCIGIILLSSQVFANNLEHEKNYRLFSVKDLPKSLQRATAKSLNNFHSSKIAVKPKAFIKAEIDQNKYKKTEQPLDVALLDEGYIVTRTPGPLRTYAVTRFGQMHVNMQGEIVIFDLNVQDWGACHYSGPNWPQRAEYNCDIQMPAPILPPAATTEVKMKLNLNTRLPKSENYNAGFWAIDSRGEQHRFSVQFITVSVSKVNVIVTDENSAMIANGELKFDKKGELAQQVGLKPLIMNNAEVEPLKFDLDLSGTTNYSSLDSTMIDLNYNGYGSGELYYIEIMNDGSMGALYSNGIKVNFAQIHTTIEDSQDLTPYLPLYPNNVWTFKEHPERMPAIVVGIRFLTGWLEKEAYRLPGQ